MNTTDRNRAKRKRKRDREIQEFVAERGIEIGTGIFNEIPQEDKDYLASQPHPKLPNSELNALDYVSWWLVTKGYHKKGSVILQELLAR